MKKLLILAAAFGLSCGLYAADAKEAKVVKLTGTAMCAKCELGEAEKCTNALQVTNKKNGKVRTYTFTANMEHGKYFCQGTTEGVKVTGTVERKDGKLLLTPKTVTKG
ncbi:MAG: hypothetical protein HOH58_11695 [Opitutaceae bacterium]|jgi:hypothetical protein|nr:hypothetical protein [Opitutaceae bacterium]